MKKTIYILLFLTILSCEKSEDLTPTKESIISKITTTFNSSDTKIIEIFFYDETGRLILIESFRDDWNSLSTLFEYSDTIIIQTKDYHITNMSPEIDTFYLNETGLVINSGNTNYTYNDNGFLQLEDYSFNDNNVTEYYKEYYDASDYLFQNHYKCSYYKYENTIYYSSILPHHNGNNNIGINFWGKQNKNLLKKVEIIGYNAIYHEFKYKFDSFNRVTKMDIFLYGEYSMTQTFEYCE